MIDTVEKGAIISGIGISRIGRRTGIPDLELTVESGRAAISDAGLTPGDIDGLTTMGDTPPGRAARALGIEPTYRGGGFSTGGLLSPVMSAFIAVAEGRAADGGTEVREPAPARPHLPNRKDGRRRVRAVQRRRPRPG